MVGRYDVGGDHFTHSLPHLAPHLVVGEDTVHQDVEALAGVEDNGDVEAGGGGRDGPGDPGDPQEEGEEECVPQRGDDPGLG